MSSVLERFRGLVVAGVGVVVAAVIVAVAAYSMGSSEDQAVRDLADQPLDELGAPASSCQPVTTAPLAGSVRHVRTGKQVVYPTAPPAYGSHWNEPGVAPAPFSRKFYSEQDRPELESLVHNLEHGYTIVWYDETVAGDDDQLDVAKAIAEKFEGYDDVRYKLIVAPWKADDVAESGAFPEGSHVAISHWSIGGAEAVNLSQQAGVVQYCSEPSGAALESFMETYPYADSPEPMAG